MSPSRYTQTHTAEVRYSGHYSKHAAAGQAIVSDLNSSGPTGHQLVPERGRGGHRRDTGRQRGMHSASAAQKDNIS